MPITTAGLLGATLGGSAISAIGNFFTGNKNAKEQRKLWDKQSKFSREERIAQQQWIEDMQDKTNAYNTPSSQMTRYKQAGLNPDLVYGQLDTSNMSAPSPASQASTPTAGNVPRSNSLGYIGQSISEFGMQQAQIENMRANTNKTNAETKKLDIENESLPDMLRQTYKNLVTQGNLSEKEIEKKNVEIQQISASTQSALENIKLIQAEVRGKNDEIDYRSVQRAMDTDEWKARMKAYQMKYDLDKQQFDHLEKMLPKLLQEKNLTMQSLANQVFLSSQEVEYQRQYGDELSKKRYAAESGEYDMRRDEAKYRSTKAQTNNSKEESRREEVTKRYGENPSMYAKVIVALSDMLSVFKGILSFTQ